MVDNILVSFIEQADFCTPEEFTNGFKHRIQADSLAIDERYMFLARGRYREKNVEVKWPTLVSDLRLLDIGGHLVSFFYLDEDLSPVDMSQAVFQDGLWISSPDEPQDDFINIRTGYFKGYTEGWDPELLAVIGEKTPAMQGSA